MDQHSWLENGPGLKMYFLLNMWIFQPAMLVVGIFKKCVHTSTFKSGCQMVPLQGVNSPSLRV